MAEEWKEESIGEGLKLLSGFAFPSSKFSNEDGFPLIRIRDVVNSTIETYYLGSFLPMYVIEHDDMLIGMDGDFNLARWKNQDALLNQRVLKVDVLDSEKLDREFVYYWLQPYVRKVNELTAATTVKHLSTKDIRKAKSNIPSLSAQRKIGQILKATDQAIEKTEALIEKYQQIKAGLMHDLFTRGIGADGQLRPPREQAPELYQHTQIGWIPKEWKLTNIKSCAEIHNNLRLPLSSEVREKMEGEFRYYGPTGIVDYIHEYRVEGKFALIGEDGDHFLKFNRMEMTQLVEGKFNVNNHAHILKGTEFCLTEWIFVFYLQRDITFWLTRQGAGRYKLNKSTLEKLPVALPNIEEQKLIIKRVFHFRDYIRIQSVELSKLKKQKSGLMHDLLTGKVQVNVNPPEAAHG